MAHKVGDFDPQAGLAELVKALHEKIDSLHAKYDALLARLNAQDTPAEKPSDTTG